MANVDSPFREAYLVAIDMHWSSNGREEIHRLLAFGGNVEFAK